MTKGRILQNGESAPTQMGWRVEGQYEYILEVTSGARANGCRLYFPEVYGSYTGKCEPDLELHSVVDQKFVPVFCTTFVAENPVANTVPFNEPVSEVVPHHATLETARTYCSCDYVSNFDSDIMREWCLT